MVVTVIIFQAAYPCTVPEPIALFVPFNAVKLLQTAASRVDMSPSINNTSDFAQIIFFEGCKKKVLLNTMECDAQIDQIRMWNVGDT